MIKTPLSTAIGGVGFYTKNAVVIGRGHKSEPELPFDIASVFSNGEQGLFYDPHTLDSSLVGQTVPTVPDLSSNENHGSNANSAQQMLLEVDAVTGYKYLKADGVDDFLQTPIFILPKPYTLMIAYESTKDTPQALVSGYASGYLLQSTNAVIGLQQNSGNPTFNTSKLKTDIITVTSGQNGVRMKTSLADVTRTDIVHDAPFANAQHKYIGAFGPTTALNAGMKLYGLLLISRELTAEEESAVRKEFNKRMGVV